MGQRRDARRTADEILLLLCDNATAKIAETESVTAGVDIVTTSVMEEGGARIAPFASRWNGVERRELSADCPLSYEKLRTENAYSENAERYPASKEEKFRKIAMLNKANRKK